MELKVEHVHGCDELPLNDFETVAESLVYQSVLKAAVFLDEDHKLVVALANREHFRHQLYQTRVQVMVSVDKVGVALSLFGGLLFYEVALDRDECVEQFLYKNFLLFVVVVVESFVIAFRNFVGARLH